MKKSKKPKTVWIVVADADEGHLTWAFGSEAPARECESRLLKLHWTVTCTEQDIETAFDPSDIVEIEDPMGDGDIPRVWP